MRPGVLLPAVLLTGIAGCGGGDATDPLRTAADATLATAGAEVLLTGTAAIDGREADLAGEGVAAFTARRSRLTVRPGAAGIEGSREEVVDTVFGGQEVASRRRGVYRALGGGRWLPRKPGPVIEAARGSVTVDVVRLVSAVRDARDTGSTGAVTVLGEPARGYRTTLRIDGATRPAEVALDSAGRIVRIAVRTPVAEIGLNLRPLRRAPAVPDPLRSARPVLAEEDRQAAASALEGFADALGARDPGRACALLVPSQRRAIDAASGSCSRSFDSVIGSFSPDEIEALRLNRVTRVRVRGDVAVCTIALGVGEAEEEELRARRVDGRWRVDLDSPVLEGRSLA